MHIEPGWEPALEAALRERLNALAVGRIETVRAFADDAPPARLAFYTTPGAAVASTHHLLPRLADKLRLGDSGLQALLGDWLEGVYTAESIDAALAERAKLTHGEVIMTAAGHAVSRHAVSFYAPDSEQSGMLARAQEIENLVLQLRAQSVMADESRAALARSEAALSETTQRLALARRDAGEAQTRAHQLHVELLRETEQAQAALARRDRVASELVEIDAETAALAERRAQGEARFEELDMQLATTQERHAELGDVVIEAERALVAAREQHRAIEREAQEAQFTARTLAARQAELERSIANAGEQLASAEGSATQLRAELAALDDAAEQAGLQEALALRIEREAALGAQRSAYDELSAKLRRADEQRMSHERSVEPLREAIVKLQLEQQAASLGGAQFLEQLVQAHVDHGCSRRSTPRLPHRLSAASVACIGVPPLRTKCSRNCLRPGTRTAAR